MLETLQNLYLGFSVALAPGILLYAFLGCVVGTLVGVLPGVRPAGRDQPAAPRDLRTGRHAGHRDAGRNLLRRHVRGLDDFDPDADPRRGGVRHDLHRRLRHGPQGTGGAALAIAAVGSYVAGTVSVIALMFLAPPLAHFALRFGPPEYFALLLLGLLVLAYMSSGSMVKALAMARPRPAAGHGGDRPDVGLLPVPLRRRGAGRWPGSRSRRGGPVRAERDHAHGRPGHPARRYPSRGCASSCPRGRSGGSRRRPSGGARCWAS